MDWQSLKLKLNTKKLTRGRKSHTRKTVLGSLPTTSSPQSFAILKGWTKQHIDKIAFTGAQTAIVLAMVVGLVIPIVTLASSHTVSWTSRGDFENNAGTTSDATDRLNIDTTSAAGDVQLTSTLSTGTANVAGNLNNNNTSTGYSFQRKTWYDGARYWVAFYNGTQIQFWYSTDRSSWIQNSSATIAISTNDFSIEADSTYAFVVYKNSYSISVRQADSTTSYPGTGFSWSSASTVFSGSGSTNSYVYLTVARDSSSYLWVLSRYRSSSNYLIYTNKSTAANSITSWAGANNLDSSTNPNKYGVIVKQSSGGNMYAVWIDNAAIEGKKYTSGTGWDASATSIATGVSGITRNMSAVVASDYHIQLIYEDTGNDIQYKEYTDTWQASPTALDIVGACEYATISLANNDDLYAFWIRSNRIYCKKGVSPYASGNWSTVTLPTDTTAKTYTTSIYYVSGASQILYIYRQGASSPYDVKTGYFYNTYSSSGTIGEIGTGLRYNVGTGYTPTWRAIRWNASIPSGTTVEVAVKSCGTDWLGTYSTWQPLSDGDNLSDEIPMPIDISTLTSSTQCLEIKVRLTSTGSVAPTLSELRLDYNKTAWDYIVGGGAVLAPPSVNPYLGAAFVGANDNAIHGFSTTTGSQAWTPYNTAGAIQSRSPVLNVSISGTPTYVIYSSAASLNPTPNGYLYAINASTGSSIWSKNFAGEPLQAGIAAQKNLDTTGTEDSTNTDKWVLFVGTYDNVNHSQNKIYALDAVTGTTLWTQQSINLDMVSSSPCVDSSIDTVYFTSYDNLGAQSSLWAINTVNGTVRWSKALGNISSSPTKSGTNIYVGTDAGYLYKYPSQVTEPTEVGPNGSTWRFDATAGEAIIGYPWCSSGKIYFSTIQGRVYCVIDNGSTVLANPSWGGGLGYVSIPAPSAPLVNSSIGTGKLYVGSGSPTYRLHELDLSTGVESASSYIGSVVGYPTYDFQKTCLYVGANDGKVYSFNVASGL